MRSLTRAVAAAEERKLAAISEMNGEEPSINFATQTQTRNVLSGFDVDFHEFLEIATRSGSFFAAMSMELGSKHTHTAAWTEGLLVGLFLSTLPDDDG